ncbi:hypothetical protein Hanom_Chr14g01323331 [Helianthus anomalus]
MNLLRERWELASILNFLQCSICVVGSLRKCLIFLTRKRKGRMFLLSSSSTVTTILFVTVIAFLIQIILKIKRINNQELPKANSIWPVIGHLHLLGRGVQKKRFWNRNQFFLNRF